MGAVKSAGVGDHGDVELTRICVLFPTIGHGYLVRPIMPMFVILIRKVPPINTLSTGPITICDVSCLQQIVLDNSVESVTFIM